MEYLFLRNYIEICYIIVNEKSSVNDFIRFFYLSNYEYAQDMERLKEIQGCYGITIEFQGAQIGFQINDECLFHAKYHYCRAFYYRHRYSFHTQRDALLEAYIGRRFLWSDTYVNVDDIAAELGYSRSNIRNAIRKARVFLSTYEINVENVPYYGLKTTGDEFHIRRCFISLYSIFDINIVPIKDNIHIMKGYQSETYDAVVEIVACITKQEQFPIINIEKRRIVNYLIIQNARIQSGYTLNKVINQKDICIKESKYFLLADKIAEELQDELGFGMYTDIEKQSIAVLFMLADTNKENVVNLINDIYGKDIREIKQIITSYAEEELCLNLEKEDIYMDYMEYVLCILLLKYNYHMLFNEATDLGGGPSLNYEYPLLGRIRYDLNRKLCTYFVNILPQAQMNDIILLFSYIIQNMKLSYKKLNIAIISRNSTVEPFLLQRLIEKNVNPQYYNRLDCLWYNNALDKNSYTYDLIISDTVPQRFECKVYPYSELKNQLNSLNDYIRTNRNLCLDVLQEVCTYSFSKNSIIKKLQNIVNITSKEFEEEFMTARQYNRNIVMIFHRKNIKQNLLIVGDFEKKVIRDGMKCASYLLLLADLNTENLCFFNVLLHELTYDIAFLERLIEYPDICVINDQMNVVLG